MKKPNLLKNMLIFSAGIFGSKLILFLLLPLYTNVLTPEEYGLAEFIFTIVQLITPVISIAIYNGELRYGLSNKYDKNDIAQCTLFVIIICAIECILLIPILNHFILLAKWRIFIAIYAFSSVCLNIALIYLKIYNKNQEYALFSVTQTLILGVLNIIFLVYLKLNIVGYLMSSIISSSFIALGAFLYGGYFKATVKRKCNKSLLKRLLYFSAPFVINDISWWIIHASDKYMIANLLNISLLGLYTTAAKIPSLITSIAAVFTQAWTISAIHEKETTNNNKYFNEIFENFSITLYTIVLIANLLIKNFMQYYVGENFVSAWCYVPILLLSSAFGAVASYTNSIYSALEKSRFIMFATLFSALCNMILNYLLIINIGIWGALLATLISYALLMFISLKALQIYTHIRFYLKKFCLTTFLLFSQTIFVSHDFYIVFSTFTIMLLNILINKNIYLRIIKQLYLKFV